MRYIRFIYYATRHFISLILRITQLYAMDIYKPSLIRTSLSLKQITAVMESAYRTRTGPRHGCGLVDLACMIGQKLFSLSNSMKVPLIFGLFKGLKGQG
jgi:hypothetical protein